jgi:hypothetical protein
MKNAAIAVIMSAALFPQGQAIAADSAAKDVGDLICSLGVQSNAQDNNPAQKQNADEPSAKRSVAKQEMLCLFRNQHTGVEETYHGSFQGSGAGAATPRDRTLLWRVSISPGTSLRAGVLDQRYEAEASETNKAPVTVEGDQKPGVSLHLVTEKKNESAFLSVLSLDLKLGASSA